MNNEFDPVEISLALYKELIEDQKRLRALEDEGVDNWEGYDYAMERLEKE